MAAENKYGLGLYSDVVAIVAAQVPNQPSAPAIQQNGIYFEVTWDAPFDNHSPITSYVILLKESDGSFVENKDLCDGSSTSDPDTLSSRSCLVPISAF